jgi:hypothetical protein
MNGIFENYLRTMSWRVFWRSKCGWIFWIMWFFPAKIQISKPIDVPYIRVYVWFKNDKFDWYWEISACSIEYEACDSFALAHPPTNFIFLLGRLIFSVSINSHPDNIYISLLCNMRLWWRHWCHVTKSSINMLSLICFVWMNFLSHFKLRLWCDIHPHKTNQR